MYLIAQPSGTKKPKLYLAKQHGAKYLGVVPDNERWSSQPIEISHKEVVINLGDDPQIGSIYGVYVEPVLRRTSIKGWGEIFIYADQTEVEEQRCFKAFPIALKRVRELGPSCDWDMTTEIRNPHGNKNGTYRYKSNGIDILTLYPQVGQNPRQLVKVISHELGHGIWHRHMDATERSGWINLHDRYVQVAEVSVRDVKVMIRDIRQIARVDDYIKDAAPEEQAAVAIYIDWLKKVHSIDKRLLQDLIDAGEEPPIPDTHLHRSDMQTPITLYSKSNPAELFCEALSSYIVGDLANKNIEKRLMRLK